MLCQRTKRPECIYYTPRRGIFITRARRHLLIVRSLFVFYSTAPILPRKSCCCCWIVNVTRETALSMNERATGVSWRERDSRPCAFSSFFMTGCWLGKTGPAPGQCNIMNFNADCKRIRGEARGRESRWKWEETFFFPFQLRGNQHLFNVLRSSPVFINQCGICIKLDAAGVKYPVRIYTARGNKSRLCTRVCTCCIYAHSSFTIYKWYFLLIIAE